MSKEEFDYKCKSLKAKCTNTDELGKECNAHISIKNLKKITNTLSSILNQSEVITKDWDKEKILNLGHQGYLSLATNFPEIMTEITTIKQLISSFNMGRVKIWSHRDTIKNYNSGKPTIAKVKFDQFNTLKENATKLDFQVNQNHMVKIN